MLDEASALRLEYPVWMIRFQAMDRLEPDVNHMKKMKGLMAAK
ncbi:MAG: hypothetical protein P4L53_20985 [Candidatus Obscuribacterales bacterium]|nr:hypothetical protein [Candidatus Obscuribacterales bacterium]